LQHIKENNFYQNILSNKIFFIQSLFISDQGEGFGNGSNFYDSSIALNFLEPTIAKTTAIVKASEPTTIAEIATALLQLPLLVNMYVDAH